MIKSRSPYYINTPFVSPVLEYTCAKYKLEIYVWTGLINEPPSEPNYSITKNNPTASTGTDKINIGRLIKDFITFSPIDSDGTDLVDSDNNVWINRRIYYAENLSDNFSVIPENQSTNLAVLGYAYGLDGENAATPSNKVLMRIGDYTMQTNGKFIVPIELDKTEPPAPSLVITNVNDLTEGSYEIEFTAVGEYLTLYAVMEGGGFAPFESELGGVTSPQTVTIDFTDDFTINIIGYENYTSTDVESNTYTVVI